MEPESVLGSQSVEPESVLGSQSLKPESVLGSQSVEPESVLFSLICQSFYPKFLTAVQFMSLSLLVYLKSRIFRTNF